MEQCRSQKLGDLQSRHHSPISGSLSPAGDPMGTPGSAKHTQQSSVPTTPQRNFTMSSASYSGSTAYSSGGKRSSSSRDAFPADQSPSPSTHRAGSHCKIKSTTTPLDNPLLSPLSKLDRDGGRSDMRPRRLTFGDNPSG